MQLIWNRHEENPIIARNEFQQKPITASLISGAQCDASHDSFTRSDRMGASDGTRQNYGLASFAEFYNQTRPSTRALLCIHSMLYVSMKHNKINPISSKWLHIRYDIAHNSKPCPYAFLKHILYHITMAFSVVQRLRYKLTKARALKPGSSARENALWRAKTRALARSSQH